MSFMQYVIPFSCRHALAAAAVAASGLAWALPGAHGPNGEHLDAPAAGAAGASAAPRLEANSEAFELVATLSGGELSVLVDRYDTNEPVLGATLEVESGAIKATAKFHADHGDYAFDEPRLLQALQQPGEHALVFTLVAGSQSDLLDGTLRVAADAAHGHDDGHGHAHGWWDWRIAAGAAALALAGAAAGWLRRRRLMQRRTA